MLNLKSQLTTITQEDIDRACIDFLEEKAPYIAELMRRALFLDDEKAKLFVHKIFSQVGEDLLTNLEGSFTPLQIAPKSSFKSSSTYNNKEDEDDVDWEDMEYNHNMNS